MRLVAILAAAIGVALTVALIGYFGAGAVVRSVLAVGAVGFASLCLIHLVFVVIMGIAWKVLLPGSRTWVLVWGRLVRDSGSEFLPLSQVGGYVLGARALTLAGISGTLAAASTIVDVTLEFVTQLAYTALGLVWLIELQPDSAAALPTMIGLGLAAIAAVGFFAVQRGGLGYFDRLAGILGRGWADRTAAGAAALHDALAAIYRLRAGLSVSFTLHLACWIASALEAWLILYFAGETLPFGTVLIIETLLHAARTAAFIVPNAVGVQEGAYILLGTAFGLSPEMALALSLLKRARDLVIGVPTIVAWQVIESGRLWQRRAGTPTPIVVPSASTDSPRRD